MDVNPVNQTTGTTAQDGGDAGGSQTTGTPAAAGRDAEGALDPQDELKQLREERNLWLANKQKVEEANRIERENADLKSQLENASRYQPPTTVGVDPRIEAQRAEMADLQLAIQEAQYLASQGDRSAKLQLATLNALYRNQNEVMQQMQLQRIPEDDQPAVKRKLATNRYADPEAAYEAVLGERYKSERANLHKQQETLNEKLTDRANGVTGTGRALPVTARELESANGKTLTGPQFLAEHTRILNTEGPEAARNYATLARRGEIKVIGA